MELPPLLNFLFARPFLPFDVMLTDGRRIPVTHPESVTVYLGGLGIWLMLPSGQMEFIEGYAVTSIRSAGIVNPSDFVRD